MKLCLFIFVICVCVGAMPTVKPALAEGNAVYIATQNAQNQTGEQVPVSPQSDEALSGKVVLDDLFNRLRRDTQYGSAQATARLIWRGMVIL